MAILCFQLEYIWALSEIQVDGYTCVGFFFLTTSFEVERSTFNGIFFEVGRYTFNPDLLGWDDPLLIWATPSDGSQYNGCGRRKL